jgi:NAD(P)-dependent dehydrogenase (short-subunit alcohol dehydrogenase family)
VSDTFATGPKTDLAITHAIVGLSESLYRELDSTGSRVGVTLVCPALGKTAIASAPEYQNSVSPPMRYVPLNSLTPEEVAEQIFAVAERLRLLGIDYGQGYAFGKPEPMVAALQTLKLGESDPLGKLTREI